MKEFNLEAAKAGKPVCTRDGRPARIIYWDMRGLFSIAAVITGENSDYVLGFTKEGRHYPGKEDYNDLMMASEKHEGWINLYRRPGLCDSYPGGAIYPTEEDAKFYGKSRKDYITTVKIEWEE